MFKFIKKIILLAAFLPMQVFAQSNSTTNVNEQEYLNALIDTLIAIEDEIIVSASRVGQKTPLTYSEINSNELKKSNQGTDLPYLLQNTPSLIVTSDAGAGVGYTGMRVRGSDLTRINVTLNGVPINDAESNLVYFVDLPDIASSVDNIQIQRGVGNSSNGAAAFGASINIKTDEQTTDPFARLSMIRPVCSSTILILLSMMT